VVGAYEFDPEEDDVDDEMEEQDEKGQDTLGGHSLSFIRVT